MERHYVIETNRGLAYILIVIASILICLSLVMALGFTNDPPHWSTLLYLFQGVTLIILGAINLRSGKYYIEWNSDEIRCYLQGQKTFKTIRIADIQDLEIRLFEIRVKMSEEEIVINLENVKFEAIKRIKAKFEELKTSLLS